MTKEKPTILAVDDTELNVDILIGILKKYDVIPALSGKEALEIAQKEDIDLILLDVMMPDMDGIALSKELKKRERTKNIPIIFITAKNTEADIKEGFEAGAVDYVTKPFNPIELLSRVNTHLELRTYQHRLEERVKEELEKNRLKDGILFQKSKQAALGELLMNITHQWKQPLSELGSINLNTMVTLQGGVELTDEEIIERAKKIEKILGFMSETMETFQDFYKPEQHDRPFLICDAIKKATDIVDASFKNHGIAINIDKSDLNVVRGNENEYAQVILNLLTNAKEILLKNEIAAPCVTIKITKEQNRSKVTVCDNGGGIREEVLQNIFTPFNSGNGGSGIGLYMSKSIIEKNGGEMYVENKNDGACFTIVL